MVNLSFLSSKDFSFQRPTIEQFWNTVEANKKRNDAQLAREVEFALSASALMQQNRMVNTIQSGLLGWSARSNAPAALASYAFNKAQQQKRISHYTMREMAAYWLPLLKNVLEVIMYGSFIFVFLMQLFPFSFAVLKHYAFSLIWLQLWAPLYAIINLYVNFYAQHRSFGTLGSLQALPFYSVELSSSQCGYGRVGRVGRLSFFKRSLNCLGKLALTVNP